jgi:hypothetical protein
MLRQPKKFENVAEVIVITILLSAACIICVTTISNIIKENAHNDGIIFPKCNILGLTKVRCEIKCTLNEDYFYVYPKTCPTDQSYGIKFNSTTAAYDIAYSKFSILNFILMLISTIPTFVCCVMAIIAFAIYIYIGTVKAIAYLLCKASMAISAFVLDAKTD